MNGKQVNKLRADLLSYAELDNTSFGECASLLCGLIQRRSHLSKNMTIVITDEAKIMLRTYMESSSIIEKEESHTRTVKILEWKD